MTPRYLRAGALIAAGALIVSGAAAVGLGPSLVGAQDEPRTVDVPAVEWVQELDAKVDTMAADVAGFDAAIAAWEQQWAEFSTALDATQADVNVLNDRVSALEGAPNAPPGEGAQPGVVAVDSFAGSNDNARWVAAVQYACAQARIPWLQFPARSFGPITSTTNPCSGLKVAGPGYHIGPNGLQIANGKTVNHRVLVDVGVGAQSMFHSTTTVSNIALAGIAFQCADGGCQLWSQPSGALYPAEFHQLMLYGFRFGFGQPTAKALIGQVRFTGHWTVIGQRDTFATLGGSDNDLWAEGYLNYNTPADTPGQGRPMLVLSSMQKSRLGFLYLTAENGWSGVRVEGTGVGNTWFGGVIEGRSGTNVATYTLLDVRGSGIALFGTHVGYTGPGVYPITQSGGVLALHSVSYNRAVNTPASLDLLYQSGGVAMFYGAPMTTTGEATTVRWSNGTRQTLTPTNRAA